MTCINCQTRIQNALKKQPGISQATVSYETETADILYDSSVISLEQIQGLIDELGYSASVQKTSRAKIVSQTLRELGIIVILYFLLRHFGILNYLAPASLADAQMGYGMLFVIGLITSVHCIAMCGGINLSQTLQKDSEPVQKITIVPRTMGALGYVMHTPEEEKFLNTKKELEAMIVGMLGGRAAEEIVFDTVTTGASNDIEQATKVARAMITQYGMSERFGLMGLESIQNRYLDGRAVLNCGEATAAEIDQEVMKMLKAAYEEAKRLLTENREALDKIAAFLIEKETITGKEFMKIFHEGQGIEMEEEETSKEDVLKEETVQEEKKEAIAVVEESEFAEAAQEHHDNEE